MNKKIFVFAFLLYAVNLPAQQTVIQLYKGAAPGSESWNWDEKVSEKNLWNTKVVYDVSHPTSDDQLGVAPHSVDLYNKWITMKHSAELHLYAKGGHGFGMRTQHVPTDTWIDRFDDWLSVEGFFSKTK